ncbi:MAG: ketopantoate reductase family protein [Candidatus Omnitrophica bacterium]|nr:ketopantoate reductase family protein [Candidatus Omnitrophota bacterium]
MFRIIVIGQGALGKSLAALLSRRVHVTVFDKNLFIRKALKNNRIILKEKGQSRKAQIYSVESISQLQGLDVDVLIIATKIMDFRKALQDVAFLNPGCVLFLQNGLFDISWAGKLFKKALICRGTTTMACQEKAPGEVDVFYQGQMYLGGDGAPMVGRIFKQCQMPCKVFRAADRVVWAKLIFSSVMNPLPVITNQGYDILAKDKNIWKLVQDAVKEGKATARALGIKLGFDPMKLIMRVRHGDLKGILHRGTLFQDIKACRPTEIDYITQAIVKEAHKIGVKTPALDMVLRSFNKARIPRLSRRG